MKVLLAIDASSGSQQVVNEAAARTWPTGTAFCALSVVNTEGWEGLPTLIDEAKHEARVALESAVESLEYPGHKVFSEIQIGLPKKVIPDFAGEWKADLIMVGSRGKSALSRFFLGSVAQAVLRTAPCSVEIVRPPSSGSPASSHALKILFATDGSECSEKAALSLAKRPWPGGSQVKIICVRDLLGLENPATAASSSAFYPSSLLDEILEDARKRAEKAVSKAREVLISKGVKVSGALMIPVGDPRAILLDEAQAWGADLIVLGSHGRHGLDRLLLGSVSETVALHAHCSVEVIR